MKNKVVIADWGIYSHRAIFSAFKNPGVPATYTALAMMLGNLKRIGITKNDKIIVACDGRGNWRKEVDTTYKADRAQKRKESPINWNEEFEKMNRLLQTLDFATNWHIVRLPKIEADDVMATCLIGNTYLASPLKIAENRKINKAKVGDRVYSYNVKKNEIELNKITKVFKRKINDIYIIHFDNKTKLKITKNHPLLKTDNKWTRACDIKVGDEIYYLNSFQKNKYVLFKPEFKNSHVMYKMGYLCGAIEGDGHFDKKRKRIEFNINDFDFVKRIQQYLKSLFNYNMAYSKEDKTHRILIGNLIIFNILLEYCQIKHKQSKSFLRGYISGFFDAEGNLYYRNRSWRISLSNTDKKLVLWLKSVLSSFNFDFKLIIRKKNYLSDKPLYLLITNKSGELRFFTKFCPAIFRKYPNFKEFSCYLENGKKVTKIEKKFSKQGWAVYNIEVENNDNYFANNLLVHNCSRLYKDSEIVLCTYDSDLEQMWTYPGVKIFSPMTKRYKIKPANFNVYNLLAKKIRKETSDNLTSPILNKAQYENRMKIVDLLHLPIWVEQSIIAELESLEDKVGNLDLIPFKSLRARFETLYNQDKVVTYEKCVKYYERKKRKKKK